MKKKFVSSSLKFMTFRYKENVSCQQFYLAHLQQQQQIKMQQNLLNEKIQKDQQLQQFHPMYFNSNAAYRSNVCQFCSFYSSGFDESSENLNETVTKENKNDDDKSKEKSKKIKKMKAEKFENLLNIVDYKENIAQFNYHYALAILNEWPIESEGMDEIRKKFSILSDKRRCFLVEKKEIVSMISQNKFVLKVFKKMQDLRDLKLCNQISELVKIIWQLQLVCDKFFNNEENKLVKNFEELYHLFLVYKIGILELIFSNRLNKSKPI